MIIINCKIWFINRLPVLQVSIWKWQKMLGVSKPNVFCLRSHYLSWRCLMSTWKPSQADHISTLRSDASKEFNSRDVMNWRQDVKINWTHCGFEPTVDLWEPVDLEIPSDSWSNNANLPPSSEKIWRNGVSLQELRHKGTVGALGEPRILHVARRHAFPFHSEGW